MTDFNEIGTTRNKRESLCHFHIIFVLVRSCCVQFSINTFYDTLVVNNCYLHGEGWRGELGVHGAQTCHDPDVEQEIGLAMPAEIKQRSQSRQ